MFFSEEEKMIMSPLFVAMEKNHNEEYQLILKDGSILQAIVNTTYETDSGEEDDPNYEEFFVCLMQVTKVIENGPDSDYKKGQLIEVTYKNYPLEIRTSSGALVK